MKTWVALIIIVLVVLVGWGMYSSRGANDTDMATTTDESMNTFPEETGGTEDWNVNAAGLGIRIVKNGSGPAAELGDVVSVHYTGMLEDGTIFDSSRDRGTPITFTLGQGQVIAGWEQGILGMQVGEQRKLNIPPELAYGAAGRPPAIPANAVLIFDVELVGIQ